jgi:hypothetical protein
MIGLATHFYEAIQLNVLRNVAAVGVTDLFVGLYLTNPTDTGGGGVEVSYPEYERQRVTFSTPYIEGGRVTMHNLADILFPLPSQAAGTVLFIGISDSALKGTGNMYLYADLTSGLEITAATQPEIAAGEVIFAKEGTFSSAFHTSLLNILRGTTLSGVPSHLAAFTGNPVTTGAELSGPGYARVSLSLSAPQILVSGESQIENTGNIAFPRALGDWGSWTHWAIMPSASAGQPLVSLPITLLGGANSIDVRRGHTLRANPGSITIVAS